MNHCFQYLAGTSTLCPSLQVRVSVGQDSFDILYLCVHMPRSMSETNSLGHCVPLWKRPFVNVEDPLRRWTPIPPYTYKRKSAVEWEEAFQFSMRRLVRLSSQNLQFWHAQPASLTHPWPSSRPKNTLLSHSFFQSSLFISCEQFPNYKVINY